MRQRNVSDLSAVLARETGVPASREAFRERLAVRCAPRTPLRGVIGKIIGRLVSDYEGRPRAAVWSTMRPHSEVAQRVRD
jgi:hypothetical protein